MNEKDYQDAIEEADELSEEQLMYLSGTLSFNDILKNVEAEKTEQHISARPDIPTLDQKLREAGEEAVKAADIFVQTLNVIGDDNDRPTPKAPVKAAPVAPQKPGQRKKPEFKPEPHLTQRLRDHEGLKALAATLEQNKDQTPKDKKPAYRNNSRSKK